MISKLLGVCTILGLALSIEAITQKQVDTNDAVVLNYALTLEYLERAFYNKYQAQFSSSDFESAGFTAQDYSYFNMIQSHEQTHVSTLQSLLGASAVAECTYNFPVTDVPSYIAVAGVLENTGVMAYDGAIRAISNRAYQQAAATIATVEARHAQFLNLKNQQNPFPSAFDTAKTPKQISDAIKGFVGACPQKTKLPEFLKRAFNFSSITFENGTSTTRTLSNIVNANDIKTLNYALVLENLEAAFYNFALQKFSEADFTSANKPAGTYDYFEMIRQHENTHVTALTSIISNAGATPYPVCTYDFSSVNTVDDFFSTAGTFENVGVMAYDGAVNTLTNGAFLEAAATIATVEARHAGYLNEENGLSPFPNAFDPTKTPSEIASIVATYQTCDFTIYLPEILYITAIPPKTGANNPSNPSNPTKTTGKTNLSNPTKFDGIVNKAEQSNPSKDSNPSNPSNPTRDDNDANDSNPSKNTNPAFPSQDSNPAYDSGKTGDTGKTGKTGKTEDVEKTGITDATGKTGDSNPAGESKKTGDSNASEKSGDNNAANETGKTNPSKDSNPSEDSKKSEDSNVSGPNNKSGDDNKTGDSNKSGPNNKSNKTGVDNSKN